jgi:hypothetical protein
MDENRSPSPYRGLSPWERLRLVSAVVVGVVCGISCMSFSIERGSEVVSEPATSPTIKQHGSTIMLNSPEGLQVYYPRPYLSPPNLKIESPTLILPDSVDIVEQKPDRFTLRAKRPGLGEATIRWQAEGIPAAIPAPAVLTVPAPASGTEIAPPPPTPISTTPPKDK